MVMCGWRMLLLDITIGKIKGMNARGGGQIDIDPIYKFDEPTGRSKEQFTHIIKSTNSNFQN